MQPHAKSPPTLESVPRKLLERYYNEAIDYCFAGKPLVGPIYRGTTFEEAWALARIDVPSAGARVLISRAPDHAKQGHAIPRVQQEPRLLKFADLGDRKRLSLDAGNVPSRTQRVWIHDVGTLTGIGILAQLRELVVVEVRDVDETAPCPCERPRAIESLVVSDSPGALEELLRVVRPDKQLEIAVKDLDLRFLKKLTQLEVLRIAADQFGYLPSLAALGNLRSLMIRGWHEELAEVLPKLRHVETLEVFSGTPINLQSIADMPQLRHVWCTVFPQQRDQAVALAISTSPLAWKFEKPRVSIPEPPQRETEYKGVGLRKVAGPNPHVMIEHDFVNDDLFDAFEGDNGDLEDAIRKVIKDKAIRWDSESGTFVAKTPDLKTAKRIVDAVRQFAKTLGGKKGQKATTRHPRTVKGGRPMT